MRRTLGQRIRRKLPLAALRLLDWRQPLVRVTHCPPLFQRRRGNFTANVCGYLSFRTRSARYRINDSEWIAIGHTQPRVPMPLFTLELSREALRDGENHLEIEAVGPGGRTSRIARRFRYSDALPALPVMAPEQDSAALDVQDGHWEVVQVAGAPRLRPVPGSETYDRIVSVCGAFPGPREVRARVTFRGPMDWRPYGFGVLPLWGGRPNEDGSHPRGGWDFALGWYYSKYEAVGAEFSYRAGEACAPAWVACYRNFDLCPDSCYRIRCQVWPVSDPDVGEGFWRLAMKWWSADQPEPEQWMVLDDRPGAPLAFAEYGVALIAHCCHVEFDEVAVCALESAEPGASP